MRKFEVEITYHLTLNADQAVFDQVDDEWRSQFYHLHGDSDIAEHLALRLLDYNRLSQVEGWADMDDSKAKVCDVACAAFAREVDS